MSLLPQFVVCQRVSLPSARARFIYLSPLAPFHRFSQSPSRFWGQRLLCYLYTHTLTEEDDDGERVCVVFHSVSWQSISSREAKNLAGKTKRTQYRTCCIGSMSLRNIYISGQGGIGGREEEATTKIYKKKQNSNRLQIKIHSHLQRDERAFLFFTAH